MAPEEYREYLEMLSEMPVEAWRDQDGTLYMKRMPASMAPAVGMVDSPVAITPDSPVYAQWVSTVEPEYDFMLPTQATPEPRRKEAPRAEGTDDHAQGG